VAASLLAFLLNYPVSWMERQGAESKSLFWYFLALSILLALGVTPVPLVLPQAQQLVIRLPEWIDSGRHQLNEMSGLKIARSILMLWLSKSMIA